LELSAHGVAAYHTETRGSPLRGFFSVTVGETHGRMGQKTLNPEAGSTDQLRMSVEVQPTTGLKRESGLLPWVSPTVTKSKPLKGLQ
jgi:hypothetical protein